MTWPATSPIKTLPELSGPDCPGAQAFVAPGPGAYWKNGGNTNGADSTLGTLDTFALSLFAGLAGGVTKQVFASFDAVSVAVFGVDQAVVAASKTILQAGTGSIIVRTGTGPLPILAPSSISLVVDPTSNGNAGLVAAGSGNLTLSSGPGGVAALTSATAVEIVGHTSIGPAGTLPDASAGLDLSTIITLGLGLPKVPGAILLAIATPLAGLTAFDTTHSIVRVNVGTSGVPNYRKAAGGSIVFATNNTQPLITDNAAAAVVANWSVQAGTNADGAFNGTSGIFTAPVAGFYRFTCSMEFAAAAATLSAPFDVGIYVGGVLQIESDYENPVAALSQTRQIVVTGAFQLAAGALVDFRAFQHSGGDIALTASLVRNYVSIELSS